MISNTNNITFNSVGLKLHQITASLDGSTPCSPTSRDANDDDGQVALGFSQTFPAGSKVQLHLVFSAPLSGSKGYYKSKEGELDGEAVYTAVTQFHVSGPSR